MDPQYPYAQWSFDQNSVFFTDTPHHEKLVKDAAQAIMALFLPGSDDRDYARIQAYLVRRYGGERHHYRVRRCSRVRFLIVLPEYLDRETVMVEGRAWAESNNIAFHLYDHRVRWKVSPQPIRIYIRVINFPYEFWHPTYFNQFTVGFGEALYADGENTRGIDRSTLRLTIKTYDPCLIPYRSTLHYENGWTECRTEIIGWEMDDSNLPADYTGQTSGGSMEEVDSANEWGGMSPAGDTVLRQQLAEVHRRLTQPPPASANPQRELADCITARSKNQRDGTGPWQKYNATIHPTAVGGVFENDTSKRLCLSRQGTCPQRRNMLPTRDLLWLFECSISRVMTIQFSNLQKYHPRRVLHTTMSHKIHPFSSQIAKKAFLFSRTILPLQPLLPGPWVPLKITAEPSASANGSNPQTPTIPIPTPQIKTKTAASYNHIPKQPSILGPPPKSTPINPIYKPPSLYKKFTAPQSETSLSQTLLKPRFLQRLNNKKMNPTDEELIKKFADLQTESQSQALIVALPSTAIQSRNWDRCVLVKVISDRTIFDAQFERQMRRAWGVHPSTSFTMTERGLYLVECENKRDFDKIITGGPWSYRDDLVVATECASMDEIDSTKFTHAEIWVQFHNLQAATLTEEGVRILTDPIGMAMSEPVIGYVNGKQFFRIKILTPLQTPIKDRIRVTNPILGDIEVYLVYERVGRICCFCGSLGHDLASCADRAKLVKIKSKMAGQNRPELEGILKPTRGLWITDQTLLPIPSQGPKPQEGTGPSSRQQDKAKPDPISGLKRSLSQITRTNPISGSSLGSGTLVLVGDLSSPNAECSNEGENGGQQDSVIFRKFKAARPSADAGAPLLQK